MWFPKLSLFLLSFGICCSLFQAPAFAIKKSYIVYLGSHVHGPEVTDADLDRVTDSHYNLLGSFLGTKEKAREAIFDSYQRHINGFAATLEEEEAAEIAKHPEVVSVFHNRQSKLQTTHSWELMSLEWNGEVIPGSLWTEGRFGEDTIIANLDTVVFQKTKYILICNMERNKVKGKIAVCLEGGYVFPVMKGLLVAEAGAAGMIMCNHERSPNETSFEELHFLPVSHLNYEDCRSLYAYINSSDNPMAYFTPPTTQLYTKPAPLMAVSSSRGPNPFTPEILKPDITAPGVDIIAANTEAVSPTGFPEDTRRSAFLFKSGTSMSCPHVAGVAGLLKTLKPDWSPAAIRSAIMTTAETRDNTGNALRDDLSLNKSTPFGYGSGHIKPNRAMNPGLVYDLRVEDYLDFLCAIGYNQSKVERFSEGPYTCPESGNPLDLNYPSIAVPKLSGSVTISRKLKNVGTPGNYTACVCEPFGISVSVEPSSLQFENIGEEKGFKLTLKAKGDGAANKDYVFGALTWTDGKHYVRSPIAVAAAAST
ncbi:PREDICTED: subtilisin-like protease SBT5.4 [Theobroma cacao]|uniref:Subtilisin-like protease SBT5.4 n=1 Tax=Theobroma cacao TaxID=3641 RepID=A0AB32WKB2_THECC|nr:PREDICTED: subtilisin-like protease SBT5.4 [Theobroma cacao]